MQGLQGCHQPQLVFRAGAGENIHFTGRLLQLLLVHSVQILAGEHLVGIPQPQLAGDGSGGQGVVAGDHFYPDTGTVAFFDSPDGFLPGRVQQAHHTQQFSPLLQLFHNQLTAAGCHGPASNRQHPQAFGRHPGNDSVPCRVVKFNRLTVIR